MKFKCDECGFAAPYRSMVKWHKVYIHSDLKPWACKAAGCSFRTKTVGSLNVHTRLHEVDVEKRKPYACTFDNCEYRGTQASALSLHVKSRHTQEKTARYQCPLCPAKYSAEGTLRQHIPVHTKELKLTCKHCDFTTHHKTALALHVRTLHTKRAALKCNFPGCTFTAPYKSNLLTHQKVHDPDSLVRKPVACKYPGCTHRSRSVHDMKVHAKARHNQDRTKDCCCPMCPKKYYDKYSLGVHIRSTHVHEGIYECQKCQFVTKYPGDLRLHCRRAHGEQPEKMFKCESCDYHTPKSEGMTLHNMTFHSAERMFQCGEFGCSFKTNYRLSFQAHLLTHENDPQKKFPFPCGFPGCDFRRATKVHIRQHMELHQKSHSQLECDLCPGRSYPDEKSLNFHIRVVHKQPYKCSICMYSVYSKSVFVKHVRKYHLPSFISVKERIYACDQCDFKTLFSGNLSGHRKRMHPRHSSSHRLLQKATGSNSCFVFQCSLCNYGPHDDQDAMKHGSAHKTPMVLLNRLHLVKR